MNFCDLSSTWWFFLDAPSRSHFAFQDPSAPLFEGLAELHDTIAFFIINGATGVLFLLFKLITTFDRNSSSLVRNHPTHSIEVEWLLTGLTVLLLLVIAFPSFRLLYLMDDSIDATMTLKAVAEQWNWSFEYSDLSLSNETPFQTGSHYVEAALSNIAFSLIFTLASACRRLLFFGVSLTFILKD